MSDLFDIGKLGVPNFIGVWFSFYFIIIFKNIYLFIYFAAPCLSCGTRDLQSSLWHAGSSSCGMRDL